MNKNERIKMVKAMEFIVRNLNDEGHIMAWLLCGVADGDIEYGDLSVGKEDDYAEMYIDDDTFAYIMGEFLAIMNSVPSRGEYAGLFCDGVKSEQR